MPPPLGLREAERRAQVLRAARQCIVSLGYEHATMRDIAEAAGVSTGTLVHYFGDKESVLEAALLEKIQDTGIAFRAALEGAQTAWERLERLIDASLPTTDEVRDEWRLWITFWGEATRNERFLAISERQHGRWTRFLARILRGGVSAGEFASLDPDAIATQIAALLDGFAVQATLGNRAISPVRMRELCLDALRQFVTPSTR